MGGGSQIVSFERNCVAAQLISISDVTDGAQEITVSLYDKAAKDIFIGQVRLRPVLTEGSLAALSGWHSLKDQSTRTIQHSGVVSLLLEFESRKDSNVGCPDFQILKLIGKGTCRWRDRWNAERITFSVGIHGQTYQVRKKDTGCIYAMKIFPKVLPVKPGSQQAAARLTLANLQPDQKPPIYSAFFANLRFSFESATDIYCITDFLGGGELFWHLRNVGRFQEDRG